MTSSGELAQSAPLQAQRCARGLVYKALCVSLLALQGGALDFYLIVFNDLFWCSWIATDLVVLSGWGVFFVRNARSRRERACGFHQKSSGSGSGSGSGCSLGDFTYAHLAWLIYVIACTPKLVLILETPLAAQIAAHAPCGLTGLRAALLLCAPLLYCLVNALVEDPDGATRHRAHGCFLSTCVDLMDAFAMLELLLLPPAASAHAHLRYTVLSVFVLVLALPVVWLHELTASERRCRGLCTRFCTCLAVNAPLLAVRCLQVLVHEAPVPVLLFKNVFFLLCGLAELAQQCAAARGRGAAQVSHCVSENDMCTHGYVNTLAVSQP